MLGIEQEKETECHLQRGSRNKTLLIHYSEASDTSEGKSNHDKGDIVFNEKPLSEMQFFARFLNLKMIHYYY